MRVLVILVTALHAVSALWPAPRQYTTGNKTIKLEQYFYIEFDRGFTVPADLREAITAAAARIRNDYMVPLEVDLASVERAVQDSSCVLKSLTLTLHAARDSQKCSKAQILIKENNKVASIADNVNLPFETRDESYTLVVPVEGQSASLTARTSLGLLRGLQTFTQLVYTTLDSKHLRYIRDGPLSIQDQPAFPVRGLLLDTARNYYPVKDIKRTLNAMSFSKMNYFHWHITDSQSWPVVAPSLPELSAKAAYYPSQVYTLDTIKDVVRHANATGIEVMVEIDSPGHTSSIALSHPDLVACTQDPWTVVAAEPNPGQLRPTEDKAIKLIQTVYKEVMSVLPGKLFDTGGDEINLLCFENDTITQTALQQKGQTIVQAIGEFVKATHATVRDAQKTPVVWEDTAVGDEAIPLGKDTIVTAWRGNDTFASILDAGFRTIQSSYELSYLDCGHGGWVGPGQSWCPYTTWWTIYDSLSSLAGLTDAQRKLVLGGQAALWSEQSGPEVVDSLLWPRAAAVGEVWWLGEDGINGQGLNGTTALGRLHDFRYRMVNRGIAAKPLQPHWCALRPLECLA